MFDFQELFDQYCREHALPLHLSFTMPAGYENANVFAYEQTRNLYGDSAELKALFDFWIPCQPVPAETYNAVFSQIDESISHGLFLEETT